MTTAFYTHDDCLSHETGNGHPECAARLQAIEDHLIAGRLDIAFVRESGPLADMADVLRVHHPDHVATLCGCMPSRGVFGIDGDTFVGPSSWTAALRAAGLAVAATNAVIDAKHESAFCSVRPPGHHAEPDRAMGFCLLNNVAIAARHALDVRGLTRVAIIDFDVHHGNGTEAVFAGDDRVLMCSVFQHPFYPHSGVPPAASNMVNVPLPARSKGDAFREAVAQHWLPRLERFAPEMLFISAGFDAHLEDDMANLGWVEADYAWVTEQLRHCAQKHAGGRIVSVLEGGYDFSALGRSVAAHLRVLGGL